MDTSKDGDIEQLVEKFKAVTVNEPLTQTKSTNLRKSGAETISKKLSPLKKDLQNLP